MSESEMVFLGKLQIFQKAKMQSPHSLGQCNPLFVYAGLQCLRPEPEPEPARGEGPAQARQLRAGFAHPSKAPVLSSSDPWCLGLPACTPLEGSFGAPLERAFSLLGSLLGQASGTRARHIWQLMRKFR